jgi:hypothetical protein
VNTHTTFTSDLMHQRGEMRTRDLKEKRKEPNRKYSEKLHTDDEKKEEERTKKEEKGRELMKTLLKILKLLKRKRLKD